MVAKDITQEIFLYREMQEGKEYAFDFFFSFYYPGLCVYAQKMFSINEDDSRNLVQDVFLKFWNDRKNLNVISSVRAYLFTSVKNKCLDFLKQNKRKPETFNVADIHNLTENYTDTFVLSELETLLDKALEKLPGRCRDIFELSRFEGLKNREIAGNLNLSEKTVENQMTKALRILKSEFKDYLPLLLLFESFQFFK
jgi:RNA polymerase sigma-70 factor (ECF subfamily)